MEWCAIGQRIRKQREFLGYSREYMSEKLDITPKFCSDIELGLKGMSVATLCRIAHVLSLSVDYILFGTNSTDDSSRALIEMIKVCPSAKRSYLEEIVKQFLLSVETSTPHT